MRNEVKKFRNTRIMHPSYETLVDQIVDAIYNDKERPIIVVMGPPGIGKTSLLRCVMDRIISLERARMKTEREYIPITGIRTPSPEVRVYPWKDLYHSVLYSLYDPAARSGIHCRDYTKKETQRELGFEFPTEQYLGRGTKGTLYRHMLRSVEHRKPLAVCMDEAHHLVFSGSHDDGRHNDKGGKLQLLANHIKSMADEIHGAKLVLFGTYDLWNLIEQTTQGIRRTRIFEFRRYDYPDATDPTDPFIIALLSFCENLEDYLGFDPAEHYDELYMGCLGCIGLLKSWFERALTEAKGDKISLELMRSEQTPNSHLEVGMNEILDGEAHFAGLHKPSDKTLWEEFAPQTSQSPEKKKKNPDAFKLKPRVFRKGGRHEQ